MNSRLLTTKFHIPPQRAGLVARPRLLDGLQRGLDEHHKLMLISAPAGYGKTTLVAEWIVNLQSKIADQKLQVSWLSLDEADNDLRRFLRYFLAAFQQGKEMPTQAQALLEMPGLPPLPTLLDELLNDLAALDAPLVLILDDYHVINSPEIHTALEYFLDHQPASMHLVLTTRADPPLSLARLRARHQMTEVRARDLRFTADEARAFFGLANLPLAENALRALDERTEGWAVGLQLAALALQHQPSPSTFIESFRGSHRYVLDYLAEEVVHQQNEAMRFFLMQTSLLDRFNAELCDTLTGRDDSQAMIAELEQSNLFIIPLDDERHWYRYHHLFADYLRSLLTKPEQLVLCQKAALWHEAQDLIIEAVRYALACSDSEFAAEVIERALRRDSTWSDGNLAGLAAWLESLPTESIQSRPRLGLYASRVFYLQGRFDEAERQLAQAEKFLFSQPLTPENDILLAMAELYHGAIAAVRGDFQQTLALIPAAQTRIPPEHHLAHARAFFSLGLAYEISGQIELATENYLKSSTEACEAGVLFLAIHGLCSAAQAQIQQGCLRQAEQSCQDAIRLTGGARIPPLGLANSVLGGIALERNELVVAERFLLDGIALSRKGGLQDDLIVGLAFLGRLRAYQGDRAGMQVVTDEVRAIMQTFGIPRMEQMANAYLARFQHFIGQHEAAGRWASVYQASRAEPMHEFEELTLARILISSGELASVRGILHPLLEKSLAAGQMRTVLEAYILLVLYHYASGEAAFALELLEKALKLAAPEGYVRFFLDEGPLLLDLLPKVRYAAPELVDAILAMQPVQPESRAIPLERLLDPLSEQETRVLQLVVAGKSNAEIADELIISVGTAKWHVHNILQKLGVANRPQAIARARELGF